MIHEKSILVTGGAGFLGCNFVQRLVQKEECCVINLDALTRAANLESLSSLDGNLEHHFVLGSVAERSLTDYLMLRYQPCAIVNFAAEICEDPCADPPQSFEQTNTGAFCELLESARRYWNTLEGPAKDAFRFIQISTAQVFGKPAGVERDEQARFCPESPYAASRAAADLFALAYYRSYEFPVLVAHCTANFGPHQFPQKFIPQLIRNASSGRSVSVNPAGDSLLEWIYVGDTCRAVFDLIERGVPGNSYNISSGERRTPMQVAETVCSLMDELCPDSAFRPHAGLIKPGDGAVEGCGLDMLNSDRIRNHTGWKPQETFESGLRKTIQWYLKNNAWCNRVLDGSYQGDGDSLRLVQNH